MKKLRILSCAFMLMIVSVQAQAQFELVITNAVDIPLTQSNLVTVNIRWNGSGSNDLFTNGVNAAGIGLRIVNAGSTVAALKLTAPPYSSTTAPNTTEIIKNSLFDNPQTNRGPTSSTALFTNVSGTTKILGTLLTVNGTNGVKPADGLAGTLLPLAQFRLFASDLTSGTIILEAGFLRPGTNTQFIYGDPASGQPFDSLISTGTASFNVIAAVPEPATWAMLIGCTLAAIAGIVYYKRRQLHLANSMLAEPELVE